MQPRASRWGTGNSVTLFFSKLPLFVVDDQIVTYGSNKMPLRRGGSNISLLPFIASSVAMPLALSTAGHKRRVTFVGCRLRCSRHIFAAVEFRINLLATF
jgi:hypothetical protein